MPSETGLGAGTSITVGGDLKGGGDCGGRISVSGNLGQLTIGGSVLGGSASGATNLTQSGYIGAGRIAKLIIGGSVAASVFPPWSVTPRFRAVTCSC